MTPLRAAVNEAIDSLSEQELAALIAFLRTTYTMPATLPIRSDNDTCAALGIVCRWTSRTDAKVSHSQIPLAA